MPTYDYGCDACGATWEVEQRITADPVKKCPTCKKQKARRMITGGNFILKGGGWYADLYHKPKGGSSSSGSSESSGDSSSSGSSSEPSSSDTKADAPASTESKSDTKPAKKKKAASG